MEEIRNKENRDNDYFCSFLCKENDNIDNKLKKVVSRCHSLLFEENDNIDNKDNSLIKEVVSRCHSLLFEKNDNKDNKENTISVNQQYY